MHSGSTTHYPPLITNHAAARRGVLLLVVLILLVLFAMMALTYVLVATRQLSTSKAYARKETTGDPPPQVLDGVMMQLLRGSTNQHSVLYPHSLLEHMYGPYSAVGSVSSGNISSYVGGQIVEFSRATLSPSDANFTLNSSLLGIDGYLEGCVITMTSGPAKGLTSRIVRYDASNPSNPIYHVLAFKGSSGPLSPAESDPTKNVTFIINGRAFSGTGFGFNPTSGVLDAKDGDPSFPATSGTPGKEFALLPNPVFYRPTQFAGSDYNNAGQGVPFGGVGGGNTDYDAPDYQHMAMSWTATIAGQVQTILPSFHRPDLVNYWANRASITNWNTNPDLLRKIVLRPNPIDHPNFTGSNQYFSAANFTSNIAWNPSSGTPCPWDVDNDGDGVADSVWIDAGYPAQMAADGKLYKPLFAILCVDLDGRLNVNAAGTTEMLPPSSAFNQSTHSEQFVGAAYSGASAPTGGLPYFPGPFAGTDSNNVNPQKAQPFSLSRGEGGGPAENDIVQYYSALLQEFGMSQASALTDAAQASGYLLQGGLINSAKYDGRYGDANTSNATGPQAGVPGLPIKPTLLGEVMRFQYPDNNFDPPSNVIFPLSSFASPPDLWSRMAIGLDFRGQPLYWKPVWTGETQNNPYDMNLNVGGSYQPYGSQSADNPFGVFELERLLRQFDVETGGLPRRLWDLSGAGPLAANPTAFSVTAQQAQAIEQGLGRTLTTDSWDPPSPGVVAPSYLRDQLGLLYGRKFATNIVELLTAKLTAGGVPATQINAEIRKLLSPELIAGMRMNINRPLGDGRNSDSDNNGGGTAGVVDEPTSSELQMEGHGSAPNQWSWLDPSLASVMPNLSSLKLDLVNGVDVNGDGVVDLNDQALARQLLARHLYVLARLMIDDSALGNVQWFANEPTLTSDQIKELAIRRIAQWAVNVVDYMDPDNIMTPFEYDFNPWNGWQTMDGDPSTDEGSDRRLVWGCERPELLLTESMAFHDRRVKDSGFDNGPNGGGNGKKVGESPTPDATNTYDQVRIPQGSAFFELYCTGNANQPQQSADLYDHSTGQWMLDLGKMAPADNANNIPSYPVWRLAITGPNSNNQTPDNDVQAQIDPTNANGHPASYSFDTANPSASLLAGVTVTPPTIERVVWFTGANPAGGTYDVPSNKIYYRHGGTSFLGCGQYAVIGPRQVTRIGWTMHPASNSTSMYAAPVNEPSCSKIVLTPGYGGVFFTDQPANGGSSPQLVNYPGTGSSVQNPLAIIAAADLADSTGGTWDSGWSKNSSPAAVLDTMDTTAQSWGIGVSVSEPLPGPNYYQEPLVQRDAFDGEVKVTDCYGPLNETPDMSNNSFLDQPEDSDQSKDRLIKHMPSSANGKLYTGTYLNYKTVLLQRLANPLVPYNSKSNPYLTVDWMPIDLTVFNGQAMPSAAPNTDPDDNPNLSPTSDPRIRFASRQRNGKLSGSEPACTSDFNVWFRGPESVQPTRAGDNNSDTGKATTVDDPPPTAENDTTNTMLFKHQLKYFNDATAQSTSDLASADVASNPTKTGLHTFGFVDSYFQQPLNTPFGQTGQTYGPLSTADVNGYAAHVGDPRSPFPWLAWSNRPYANVAELMMVPATHPGRLLYEFTPTTVGNTDDVYTTDINPTNNQQMPFGHLLNFFSSPSPANSTSPNPNSANVIGLSRVFEYLQVPSPFVGTQNVLNPLAFAWTGGAVGEPSSSPAGVEPAGTAGLHPPFNLVSNYRDPGKVNINTISDASVWNALVGGADATTSGVGPAFDTILKSRQGRVGSRNTFDSTYPSMFVNPFRSAAGADMVPLASLSRYPTNATLWRAGGPLEQEALSTQRLMVTPGYANQPYRDMNNNVYFNFQSLAHLTSKLTTRSNVYAVWITVGYFEVTPWYGLNTSTGAVNTSGPQVFDTAHPDGFQLGQELGADTGQIERHRAFYIIDRSIPVGFQRGYDINVNNAVLLKRFIE